MTDRELMQQALDALEKHTLVYETAELLRARLTRIRCIVKDCQNHRHEGKFVGDLCGPCHTFITTGEGKYSQAYRNSQREWQGLTDEEMFSLWVRCPAETEDRFAFARAIEQALKEKLTDEEIKNAWSRLWYDLSNGKFAASDDPSRHTTVMFARAIEAKLKEKNNG